MASVLADLLGALLRREGLYSSNLSVWRSQRDEGALSTLSRRPGRPKTDPLAAENEKLPRRAERAEAERPYRKPKGAACNPVGDGALGGTDGVAARRL